MKLPAGSALAVEQGKLWDYVNPFDELQTKIALSLYQSSNWGLFPASPPLPLGRKVSLHSLIFGEIHHCSGSFDACLRCTDLLWSPPVLQWVADMLSCSKNQLRITANTKGRRVSGRDC